MDTHFTEIKIWKHLLFLYMLFIIPIHCFIHYILCTHKLSTKYSQLTFQVYHTQSYSYHSYSVRTVCSSVYNSDTLRHFYSLKRRTGCFYMFLTTPYHRSAYSYFPYLTYADATTSSCENISVCSPNSKYTTNVRGALAFKYCEALSV